MARFSERLAANVDGDFFVDASCIDCDLCRQIAPETFARDEREGQSFVKAQPREARRALMALVTCPTASIGMTRKIDSREAARAFPEVVDGAVSFCGWASEDSFGAASWLVRRAEGNVLVDSPRASATLMARIEELGGVRWMFLTHRDDVADHEAYRKRFGCARVMHAADAVRGIEQVIEGSEPVRLDEDLLIIPLPGHTRGSAALLYRDTYLFSGDHVWADDDERGLEAGRDVCWYSWPEQRRSMARLGEHRFEWVLPGHGRRLHLDADAMRAEVRRLAAAM